MKPVNWFTVVLKQTSLRPTVTDIVMPFALVATGTVEAIRTAAVGSQVGGVITRVGFREGDEVAKGAGR